MENIGCETWTLEHLLYESKKMLHQNDVTNKNFNQVFGELRRRNYEIYIHDDYVEYFNYRTNGRIVYEFNHTNHSKL